MASAVAKNRTIVSGRVPRRPAGHDVEPGGRVHARRRRRSRRPARAPGPRPPAPRPRRTATAARTSRESHDRRRLRSALYATAGRPRWKRAPTSAMPARAAPTKRSPNVPAVRLTPTASWLTSVSHTRGQWGCSGRTFQSLAAYVSSGRSAGSVMRVVDRVMSALGSCGASAARWSARQSATFTFSTVIACVGQASTHAGSIPSARRGWHMSHLVTMRRSGWKAGTEYGQLHVQYWQPTQSSAWCTTIPLSSFS